MSDISDLFEEAEPPAPKPDVTKPRWPHSELPLQGGKFTKQKRAPGIFVMQYDQFDIYVYPNTFMLRWGKDFYCKHHPYRDIKDTLEGKWELPDDVQAAILAIKAMMMTELEK